jgi:hypothetical protein
MRHIYAWQVGSHSFAGLPLAVPNALKNIFRNRLLSNSVRYIVLTSAAQQRNKQDTHSELLNRQLSK